MPKEKKNKSRPKFAQINMSHGFPEIQKQLDASPRFQAVVVTTNATHCEVGKFLAKLVNPLYHMIM